VRVLGLVAPILDIPTRIGPRNDVAHFAPYALQRHKARALGPMKDPERPRFWAASSRAGSAIPSLFRKNGVYKSYAPKSRGSHPFRWTILQVLREKKRMPMGELRREVHEHYMEIETRNLQCGLG
jgi:hypothetical protein